jgi:hypothetical protein
MKTSYTQITLITQRVEEREASGRLQGVINKAFLLNYHLCNLRSLRRVKSGKQK